MKKYAVILFGLVVLGVCLVGLWLSQDQKLDQTVFFQTTASIRNLQSHDYQLATLLPEAKLNRMFDHEKLFDTYYQISEEFDNLRYEALFEEIESSPAMSEAVSGFEAKFVEREQRLEAFVESNTAAVESLRNVMNASDNIQKLSEQLRSNEANLLRALAAKNNLIQNQLISPNRLELDENLIQPLLVRSLTQAGSRVQLQESVDLYNESLHPTV